MSRSSRTAYEAPAQSRRPRAGEALDSVHGRSKDGRYFPTGGRRSRNPNAVGSVVVGLAAVVVIPVAVVVQYYRVAGTLLQSTISAVPAVVLGVWAIGLARRGRFVLALTIGRSGGHGAARTGRMFGWVGLTMGVVVALAVGFYGLLTIFARS